MLVPTLLALVLAASQVFASPTPQGASTNGLLEKKNVHYGGCTKKLLRRPWHKLSKAEKTEYLNAELCLMRLPSKTKLPGAHSRFDDLVKAHQMQADSVHGDGWFLPWHRLHMHAHEKLLREECGYTGAQPYWDEEKEAGEFSKSKIFDPKYGFGGDGTGPGGCIETGRFASYILHTGPSYENTKHCLTRQISDSASSYASKELVKNCIAFPDFKTAWPCIALNPHYAGHTGVGGEMADAISSPGDPLFYLHHTYLDRIWWRWQKRNLPHRYYDISGYTTQTKPESGWVAATLDDEFNMFGIIPNATMREVMDIGGDLLCVEYQGV